MKIISWNVNGIRAIAKKGFLDWISREKPDVLGIQEIKAESSKIPAELKYIPGYEGYFNPAERRGYSGTGLYSRKKPKELVNGFEIFSFENEGRIQMADYGDFVLFNIYFPNGKQSLERLKYKLEFYEMVLKYFDGLVEKGKPLLIGGDYNTAHKSIDLTHPEANEMISGFLPVERAWFDKLLEHGYIDCFREFNKDGGNYTWWSMRSGARERNVGWRIDYFFCSRNAGNMVKNCYHLNEVMGSDHCPVVVELG